MQPMAALRKRFEVEYLRRPFEPRPRIGADGLMLGHVVRIHSAVALSDTVMQHLEMTRDYLADAREEFRAAEGHDVEVSLVDCELIAYPAPCCAHHRPSGLR